MTNGLGKLHLTADRKISIMDKLGACSFFLTTLLLITSTSAVDKTIENEARGSTVVEAVVNLLRARCTVSDDNFFLRRMAYAASRDGEKSDTFREGFDGGIWQVIIIKKGVFR